MPNRPPQRRGFLAVLGSGGLGLSGCGFALRGTPALPFRSIALTGFAPRSPLAEALRRELGASVRVVDNPAEADLVLQALADRREKVVVASTAAGQVRELQLRIHLKFQAQTSAGRELIAPAELLLKRDLTFNETAALGKAVEEAGLYREMQADIVAQLMRRLAVVRL